jgi:hypothetical protein
MTVTMTLEKTALSELAGSFRGQLIRPDDPTYKEHRKVWNGSGPSAGSRLSSRVAPGWPT